MRCSITRLMPYLLAAALCVAAFAAPASGATTDAEATGYPGPFWPYSRIGPFLGGNASQKRNTVHGRAWDVRMNREAGLPQVLDNGVPYWDTVTVALWGLQEFDLYYFQHRQYYLEHAIRAADWLVGWQEAGGGWPYLISFTYPDGQVISPPWLAAQAQGNALSLLVRVYEYTRDAAYLRSAELGMNALLHMTVDVEGHELFEGFPTAKPSVTLEDLQLALLGLYDLSYFDSSAVTAFAHYTAEFFPALSLWDGPQGPWYDLTYLNGTPPIYSAESATFNADLLAVLAEVTGSAEARAMAKKWQAEQASGTARSDALDVTSLAEPEVMSVEQQLSARG